MRTAEWEREQARQRVAAHIVRSVPAANLCQALAAMDEAKVRHIALHAVDRHLAERPDAFRTGDPDSPAGLQRLAQALHAAGFTGVRLVGCARCGQTHGRLAFSSAAGRICRRCARQTAVKQTCARCGRLAAMEGHRAEGRICGSCVATDPNSFEECGGCGRRARVFRRLTDGGALCQRCAPQPVHPCAICGRHAPAAARTDTGPICMTCYPAHAQPHRECSACRRIRPIKIRASSGQGDLCTRCAPIPTGTCTRCGRDRQGRLRDGTFVCTSCLTALRPARQCALCRRERLINADWPIGPVCASCYQHATRRPAPCVRCGRLKVLTGTDRNPVAGARLCGPCAGGRDYMCASCSAPGAGYADGQCARCVLGTRLHAAFADHDGTLQGQYATLVTVLAGTDQPESLLANWLTRRNPVIDLLTRLARDKTPLTHDLLDELPQHPQLLHLRRLLVFAAVIPPRQHEYLHRLGPWLRDQLADRPGHHARLVHPYAEWHVLRRARRRVRRRHSLAYSPAIHARASITAALDLLTWLDQQHTAFDQLTQPQLDQWLDDQAHQHKPIRGFIRWAYKARLARDLSVPARRTSASRPVLDEEQRWHQLRRCLHEDALPLSVRVVGALTLLLGITTSRILELTTEDVAVGSAVRLTIGASPIELPPRIADLVLRQHDHANTVDLNAPELTRWLFPGQRATLPINPMHMSDQLTAAGLNPLQGRHAALVDLAAALPPPVLASLLGVHITTAIAWSHRAQQDWSAYLAARHKEHR